MKRSVTPWLIALNLLLLVLLAWQWLTPQGGLRNAHWEPPAPLRPDLGSVSAASGSLDAARLAAILARPVFSVTRRPAAPALAAAPAQSDPLDSVHLYGMFSGSEGGGVIVKVEGKTRRLKVSELLGDWRLKEIRGPDAVFVRAGITRKVSLVQGRQSGAGQNPPAPGTAGTAGTEWLRPAPPGGSAAVPLQPFAAPSAKAPVPAKPSSGFVIGGSR